MSGRERGHWWKGNNSGLGSMGQIVRKEEAEKVKVGPSHEDLLYCNKDIGLEASWGTEWLSNLTLTGAPVIFSAWGLPH